MTYTAAETLDFVGLPHGESGGATATGGEGASEMGNRAKRIWMGIAWLVLGVVPLSAQGGLPGHPSPATSREVNGSAADGEEPNTGQPVSNLEEDAALSRRQAAAAEGPEILEGLAKPGEHHQHLAAGIGTWSVALKVWNSPQGPPMEFSGTSVSRWILDGRFVETRFRSELLGERVEGLGIDGYDHQQQRYVGTWRDTLGTYTLIFAGQCDGNGKVRTMVADFVDPASGERMHNRGVTTIVDADTYRYDSFLMGPDGSEFQNLELTARRQ